jgi:hypothetical protein
MVRIWGRINYFRICRQTDRAFQIKSEGKAYFFTDYIEALRLSNLPLHGCCLVSFLKDYTRRSAI